MNTIDDTSRKVQPAPLRVSRVFSAPRETVFKAWSSADHVKRWFCPNGYSVPEATVEMRVGGRSRSACARPKAWSIGPGERSPRSWRPSAWTIDHHVIDPCGGGPLFSAVTEVEFIAVQRRHADGGGADLYGRRRGAGRADAQGRARRLAPDARQARGGNRAHAGDGGGRSVVHGAFHLERTYDATAEQVYKALSDEAAKSRWFYGPQGWRLSSARWTSASAAASGSRAASTAA